MRIRECTTLALMGSLCATGQAAQWTVSPFGVGDFTSLQAAIDFAQSGDVIVVQGGCYAGIVIDESLSIVGFGEIRRESFPCSGNPTGDSCSGVACPAIEIGPNAGVVSLSGFTIDGRWSAGWIYTNADPTVRCAPGTEVNLFDCVVTGPIAWQPTGTQPTTTPAIESIGAQLTLVRTTVTGGEHVVDAGDSAFWLNVLTVDGPPAIVGSDVLVLDSTVKGGKQGDFFLSSFDTNCPPWWPSGMNPAFHKGGAGIVATQVIRANSTIQGGAGATITNACSGVPAIYNQQPAGFPIVGGPVIALSHNLFSSNPPRIGQFWSATALFLGGTIVLGVAEPDPLTVPGHGLLFLAPPSLVFLPGNSISTLVPLNSALVGVVFGVQWISPAGELSRPVIEIIRP